MTQEERIVRTSTDRRAVTALVLAAAIGVAGCSSVPDAVNPVEWYRGTTDTVGGWFKDDEPVPPEPSTTAGDPGSSTTASYPNLSTVPERPTPSTTAAERETLKQGLISDRANARYTEPPASARAVPPAQSPAPRAPAPRSEPQSEAPRSAAPVPTEPQAALPPAAEPATRAPAPRAGSGDRSTLWPNRPAPETPGVRATTSGRVGDSAAQRSGAYAPEPLPQRVAAPPPSGPATSSREPGVQTAERTTLDSSTGSIRAPALRDEPAPATARRPAAEPSATSQSVIVNEDAIASAPAAASFTGRPYLASTIYFGHGSANLTGAEREELAQVARTAASTGAAIQVIGHASSRTADLALRQHEMVNFTMSLKRAEAVAAALIRAGAPADRVRIEAMSDAQPEFYEVMPSGEAGNRRVEVVLIY